MGSWPRSAQLCVARRTQREFDAETDLSHYDLKDTFTAREIACLVAGVDPVGTPEAALRASPEYPQVAVIQEAVTKAALRANALYNDAISGDIRPEGWSWSDQQGPVPPWREGYGSKVAGPLKALPSVVLIHDWMRDVMWFDGPQTQEPEFFRADVQEWLGQQRYAKAQYFLPEDATNKARRQAAQWPWGDYDTELLCRLAAAAEKFWVRYDPADPTTAPTNEQVTDWLKDSGVADRTAEIMASILRADGLPAGRRKK